MINGLSSKSYENTLMEIGQILEERRKRYDLVEVYIYNFETKHTTDKNNLMKPRANLR